MAPIKKKNKLQALIDLNRLFKDTENGHTF